MARITVEDCLKEVENRFEMVMTASKRARALMMDGATPAVEERNDKATVVALREIAAGIIVTEADQALEATTEALAQLEETAAPIENISDTADIDEAALASLTAELAEELTGASEADTAKMGVSEDSQDDESAQSE